MKIIDGKLVFDDMDELDAKIKETVEKNAQHLEPSIKTLEAQEIMTKQINDLLKNMGDFNIHLQYIKDKLEENKEEHKQILSAFKESLLELATKEKVESLHEEINALSLTVRNISIWRWVTAGGLAIISSIVIPLLVYIWATR